MTRGEDKKFMNKLDIEPKVEGGQKINKKSPSGSRKWSMFNNPRIVRVSRAFGGKDRHSKVTTVRGLRDRRIRLSVPTAIQLYDLQDRLGLSQPSKVVDWLINHTKDEINKLPPLQISPENFEFYYPTLNLDSNALKSTFSPYFNANLSFSNDEAPPSSMPSKDEIRNNMNFGDEDMIGKSKAWDVASSERNQDGSNYDPQVSAQKFFPISSHSFPDFQNAPIPYNSFYNLEPNSNLSLTQFGNHGFQNHVEGGHSSHLQSMQPSASQLYLYPSAQIPSVFFPNPQYTGASLENDARNASMFLSNHFMSPLHRHPQGNEKELRESSNGS